MPKIGIVTDSGSDISQEAAKALGVRIVPLVVTFGSEVFADGELDSEAFWAKTAVVHPQSSQPSVGAFEEAYAAIIAEGAEVLCVTITGKLSGTYNSALTAAQRFGDQVTVVDSLSLSWGQRFQVEAALQAAREGKTRDEIVALLQDVGDRTHFYIILDTIENLKKGGRASKLIAVVEKVVRFFNIKPILLVKEGELGLLGTANSFARGLLRIQKETLAHSPFERLASLYTRDAEPAAKFAQDLAEKTGWKPEDIPLQEIGVAVSVHGGAGAVAVAVLAASKGGA